MNFSENTNLMPGGQSASPSKVRELENKIDDLAQTVTSVADSVADLADEVTTTELNANTANITNAVIDNATVGTETATTVTADTVNADNLNATDADITNLTADDLEANSVDADNGYFGSVNAQSFTGQGVNITGDITASGKVQGKTVQATEKVVTPALESTTTELKGATTVRGDVYFPENGDKIYGEYLEIEADKVKADIEADTVNATSVTAESVTTQGLLVTGNSRFMGEVQAAGIVPIPGQILDIRTDTLIADSVDAISVEGDTVKANSLTTETPTGSSQLVGYDNNGKLIPVNAGLDPSNYWELDPDDQTTIQPKDEKTIKTTDLKAVDKVTVGDPDQGILDGELLVMGNTTLKGTLEAGDTTIVGDLTVSDAGDFDTTLRDTEVDGDLTVNGDIIQNGSAYETHAEKVYSKNDLIITRDGAVSGLSTGQYTGIQAKKYDGTNDGQLVFDKDGEARVGDVGDTEPLMTRDELADMTDGSLLQWDGINKKAVCGKSADIIPSDASASNKLVTTAAISHNTPRVTPKDITAYVSDGTLWQRLNGTNGYALFEDIYVGDYFKMSRAITAYERTGQYQITGSQYVTIAGLDTMWGNGDQGSGVNYHHAVMVPGQGFGGTQHFGCARMNATNTTEGGYKASEMNTLVLGDVVSAGSTAADATINQQLYAEFGAHLKTTRELVTKAINATGYNRFGSATGCASDWEWINAQAILMSEVEAYGSIAWSSSGYDTGNANRQLPLFAFSKQAQNNHSAYWWLKDIASAAYFCGASLNGLSAYDNASYAFETVRPRFILGA